MDNHRKVLMTSIPNCDVCSQEGMERKAKYDAATKFGPWAYLCQEHFDSHGIGLGLGQGQELVQLERD